MFTFCAFSLKYRSLHNPLFSAAHSALKAKNDQLSHNRRKQKAANEHNYLACDARKKRTASNTFQVNLFSIKLVTALAPPRHQRA